MFHVSCFPRTKRPTEGSRHLPVLVCSFNYLREFFSPICQSPKRFLFESRAKRCPNRDINMPIYPHFKHATRLMPFLLGPKYLTCWLCWLYIILHMYSDFHFLVSAVSNGEIGVERFPEIKVQVFSLL